MKKPFPGAPNAPPFEMISTVVLDATVVPSMSVSAAPFVESSFTALLSARRQPHPGEFSPGLSSPAESPGVPSWSRSPYTPGPTRTVSPAAAVMMPHVIDRHGAAFAPHTHDPTMHVGGAHPGGSMPLFAT